MRKISTDYLDGTIKHYLTELSERRITPGGGSCAALTAALGAGLNLMVINYSIKSNDSVDEKDEYGFLQAKLRQQESLGRLSLLIDEDCKVFQSLMVVSSAGGNAQDEYITASRVPMKVCHECNESLEITLALVENANKKLQTDIGCAAHILKAAFYSARLNVEVNLDKIEDHKFVEDTKKTLKSMQENIDCMAKQIIK